eukprot:Platyproteum_vivax@DN3876_c0_g1_i1.p1
MFFQNLTILTVLFFLCIKFGDARTYAISTKKNGEKTCVGLEIAAEQKESFVNIMKTVIAEKYVPFVGTVIPVHQTDQLRGYYEWNGFYSGNEMSVLDLTHMDENIGEANFKKAKKLKENEYLDVYLENILWDTALKFKPGLEIKIKSGRSTILKNTGEKKTSRVQKPGTMSNIKAHLSKVGSKISDLSEKLPS